MASAGVLHHVGSPAQLSADLQHHRAQVLAPDLGGALRLLGLGAGAECRCWCAAAQVAELRDRGWLGGVQQRQRVLDGLGPLCSFR
jgi:hypothetical protein